MSFLSASKVIFTEPSEVNSTGFHPFETTQGEVELFVNVDDHPDGNWILASNFDASDGDFANEHGYTAPSSYHLPGTSGSVTSNFSNYEGSSSLAEGPSEMKVISNNADDNITFANGSFGTAEQNGPSPHMTYKTFRPETNGYEWDEIKFRCVYIVVVMTHIKTQVQTILVGLVLIMIYLQILLMEENYLQENRAITQNTLRK